MKRIAILLVMLLALTSVLLVACGEESETTTTAAATETTAAATETTEAEAEWPAELQAVIDAAAEEGEVNFFAGNHEYDGSAIAAGIKDMFGVDLTVNVLPGDQRSMLGTLAMEMQAGAAPSFDLMEAAGANILETMKPADMLADIDWASLLVDPMDANALLPAPANYVTTISYVQTLSYDSTVLSEDDLPDSLLDMSDPQYQGKFGWVSYGTANAEILYFLDMADEDGLAWLADLVANAGICAGYADQADKLALGELEFALLGSQEYNNFEDEKFKATTASDYCLVAENAQVVLKGCTNPNAATLMVLWFVTDAGKDYMLSTGFGSYLIPGSTEYGLVEAAKAAGTTVVYAERDADYIAWAMSDESSALVDEIDAIMKGAGYGRR